MAKERLGAASPKERAMDERTRQIVEEGASARPELWGRRRRALAELAINGGDAELMRALLERGLDPNSGASDQERWLCEAGRRSSSAVFLALLEAGADPLAADGCAETPLMACCRMRFGRPEERDWAPQEGLAGEDPLACFEAKLSALAKAGVDPNAGKSAVARALDSPWGTRFERPAGVFSALAKMGLDLDAPIAAEEGGGLLHAAAAAGALGRVALLLELGADPLKKNARGQTPLQVAQEGPWPAIERSLRVAQERREMDLSADQAPRRGPRGL